MNINKFKFKCYGMDSSRDSSDVLSHFEDLKISAFSKLSLIRGGVHNVTIGPLAKVEENDRIKVKTSSSAKETTDKSKGYPLEIKTQVIESNNDIPLIPLRQIFKEYELLRQRKVQDAIQKHYKKFEILSAQQSIAKDHCLLLQQQRHDEKMRLYEEEVVLALNKYDQEKLNEEKIINEHRCKLENERKKIAAAIEAKKKQIEIFNECLNNQSQFQATYREIMSNIVGCKNPSLLEELSESWKHCKELNDLMTALIEKCKNQATEQEKDMIEIVFKRLNELKVKMNNIIENFSTEKPESDSNVGSSERTSNQAVMNAPEIKDPTAIELLDQKTSINTVSEINICSTQQKIYYSMMEYLQKYSDSIKDFLNLDNFKQFRFDCKKAVNLSVNTISAANSQHLHDKYVKLSNLLSGKSAVIGDLQIVASKHPKGIPYCIDLMAKKFVLQGDLMVSCNPESAFAFATIIVSIWNECPDFGHILLSYFFKECVYLIPFYPPRLENQTDQEYYSSQGYKYVDNKVEDQDKFLKRMTGTMRLYFAILMTFPKRSQNRHPYFINHAWTWVVSVLKLKPSVDITATMLHTFFETVGFEMQQAYGKQFSKILRYFIEIYLPLMKEIDSGGPVTRLECLIQEFKENGNKFQVPRGVLPQNFW